MLIILFLILCFIINMSYYKPSPCYLQEKEANYKRTIYLIKIITYFELNKIINLNNWKMIILILIVILYYFINNSSEIVKLLILSIINY